MVILWVWCKTNFDEIDSLTDGRAMLAIWIHVIGNGAGEYNVVIICFNKTLLVKCYRTELETDLYLKPVLDIEKHPTLKQIIVLLRSWRSTETKVEATVEEAVVKVGAEEATEPQQSSHRKCRCCVTGQPIIGPSSRRSWETSAREVWRPGSADRVRDILCSARY